MPTLACPNCGKTVRFEGVAGVCPNCASVVRVASSAPKTAPKAAGGAGSASKKSGRGSLNDLSALAAGEEEVFAPTGASIHSNSNPFAGMDKRLLYGIIGGVALVLMFGAYMVFRPVKPDEIDVSPVATVTHPVVPVTPDNPDKVDTSKVDPPQAEVKEIVHPPTIARPIWTGLKPVLPKLPPVAINDAMVEAALRHGVAYVKSQYAGDKLSSAPDDGDQSAGMNALAVYALLHSGEALDDSSLNISSPFMRGIMDRLKHYDMSKDKATYGRSLRASAFALHDRQQDRDQLRKDCEWLLKTEWQGAYGYGGPADATQKQDTVVTDNSNSQYGVLGIWAALQEGLSIPDKYWTEVEQHWVTTQGPDGGWCYQGKDGTSSLSMTCAGITSLCVAAEQQNIVAAKGRHDTKPFTLSLSRGIDWLSKGDNLLETGSYRGYRLYGVERAALATGYRYFGKHDWYRELGAIELRAQDSEGAWGDVIDTSFRLLFLARGRQPLLMDKLRFDGDWNDRPRDLAKLTQYASAQLEKPFAWGVADLSRDWWDWLESPVLMITTDTAPNFSDQDCEKLRNYANAGGLIFLHNEYGSKEVDAFAQAVSKRIFPDYPLTPATPESMLYSVVYPMKTKVPLSVVNNGSRVLMVYSPKDVTQDWVKWRVKDNRENPNMQVAMNLFVFAAGKSNFRNRLSSPYIDPPAFDPLGTIPVAQIAYDGNWNPEPAAWQRFSRFFQNQTSLLVDVQKTDIKELDLTKAPVAVLTGNREVDFGKMDLHALHDFVDSGGTLLIDATGGNKAFMRSVNDVLMPTAFPGARPGGMPSSNPILAGGGPCTDNLPKPRLRSYAGFMLNNVAPGLRYANVGSGTVIISELDLTTGLLDSGTYPLMGYTPDYCLSVAKNTILWTLSRYKSDPTTAPAK